MGILTIKNLDLTNNRMGIQWESHVFLIMVEQNIYVDRLDIYAGLSGYPAANGRSCLELWLYPLP